MKQRNQSAHTAWFRCKARKKRLEHERSVGSTLQLTLWMEENTITLRESVYRQHLEDWEKAAPAFIKKNWPKAESRGKSASIIRWTVSTTEHSTVLLLSIDSKTAFKRDTDSPDEQKPWFIHQDIEENERLSSHISNIWLKKTIHKKENLELVNLIAEHVVYTYDREKDEWKLLDIVADENNVILFKTIDFVMWSHPPRDEPLRIVLSKIEAPEHGDCFNKVKGYLGHLFTDLICIRRNTDLCDDQKKAAEAKQRKEIRAKFLKVYKFYESIRDQSRLPNSYMWPTLQIGVKNDKGEIQRYGETFAGVYERYDNEVHHIFAAFKVNARMALPSKEVVFNELLAESIGLTLDTVSMALERIQE